MPCRQSSTYSAAGISRGRLDPEPLVRALAKDAAVPDAVQGNAAGEAQVVRTRLAVERRRQAQHHLFGDVLDRACQIHFPLRQTRLHLARRSAEQIVEAPVRHRQPGGVVEIVHVQPERAVGLEIDEMVVDGLDVLWVSIRREPHDLVLAGIDLEAGVVGEGRVKEPERVREGDVPERRQFLAFTEPR